jgi:hypothetical protein
MDATEPKFEPGQAVEWLYEARGGYGYRAWFLATVVKVGKRITIDVQMKNGSTERRAVTPERLRVRSS